MAAGREKRTGGRLSMLTPQRKIHRLTWLLLTPLLLILIGFAARPGVDPCPANAANAAIAPGAPSAILP